MINIEFQKLGWETTLMRYYLLIAVVLVGGFTGIWLIGLLALPIFVSALMGMKFTFGKAKKVTNIKRLPKKVEQQVA